jgi:glycosyltransferase involved in cell wall biosynthesis
MPNVSAKGLSLNNNKYWTFTKDWVVIDEVPWKQNFIRRFSQIIYKHYKLLKMIIWADIIHWQWDIRGQTIFNIHYLLIKMLNKPVVIEWVGSDIRIPEKVFQWNPYYKNVWHSGEYSYYIESFKKSIAIQKRFKKIHAFPVVCPEMSLFIDKKIFPNFKILFQRIDVNEYEPSYPSILNNKPILIHTPSAKGAKGTRTLKRIIKNLEEKGLCFEYIELSNVNKEECLKTIQRADIFLDQFVIGSYGMASCEAMAMGKPVFCYLMEPVKKLLPLDCPIINVTLETIEKTLEEFINDSKKRSQAGIESRKYVEKYHNAELIAREAYNIYDGLLRNRNEKAHQAVSF